MNIRYISRFSSALLLVRILTLLILTSLVALPSVYATHYIGGEITYLDLGRGHYELTVRSFWRGDTHIDPPINPYGYSQLIMPPGVRILQPLSPPPTPIGTAIGTTLLPDGETRQYIQKIEVQLDTLGLYVFKTPFDCCREHDGSNFSDQDPYQIEVAIRYDTTSNCAPATAGASGSSPQFFDVPIFRLTAASGVNFNLNVVDPDGDSLHYRLIQPFGVANAYTVLNNTGFVLRPSGQITWTNPQIGHWAITVEIAEVCNGQLTGAFVQRDFVLDVISTTGNNLPPICGVNGPFIVFAGGTLGFTFSASDPNANDSLTLLSNGQPFALGATFGQTQFGNPAQGIFRWTPSIADVGSYNVQFVATDNGQPSTSCLRNVSIEVRLPTNLAPLCLNDFFQVNGGAPQLAPLPDTLEVQADDEIFLGFVAFDPNTAPSQVSISATGVPAGAQVTSGLKSSSLNPAIDPLAPFAGYDIRWTPTQADAGIYPITYTVIDNDPFNPLGCSSTIVLRVSGAGGRVLEEVCTVSSYDPNTFDFAAFLDSIPGIENDFYDWVGGSGTLNRFSDGTATLKGQLVNKGATNVVFEVDVLLTDAKSWAEWRAAGGDYKGNNLPTAIQNHPSWTFYLLDSSSTLTGVPGSRFDGQQLFLRHAPANQHFGFQIGLGANDKNSAFGLSGWFTFTGFANGHGDFNLQANCLPVPAAPVPNPPMTQTVGLTDPYVGNLGPMFTPPIGDTLTYRLAPAPRVGEADGSPRHGTLRLHGNGTYEYRPQAGFQGEDRFLFQVAPANQPQLARGERVPLLVGTPFPVELSDWQARIEPQARGGATQVRLDWTTQREVNAAFFGVERRGTGGVFLPLGQVPASGDSDQAQSYQFDDKNVASGAWTYRLRLVDQDGSFTYSQLRTVVVTGEPAPVHIVSGSGETTLRLEARVSLELATFRLLDLNGRRAFERRTSLQRGERLDISIDHLAAGLYWLEVSAQNGAAYRRAIVR